MGGPRIALRGVYSSSQCHSMRPVPLRTTDLQITVGLVLSVAVSGVVSGPPPVQRGPVLFHVGVAAAGPGVSI